MKKVFSKNKIISINQKRNVSLDINHNKYFPKSSESKEKFSLSKKQDLNYSINDEDILTGMLIW